MNKPNLSEIYRNGLRQNDQALNSAEVIALADGQSPGNADAIAASPLQADLARFSRDLETESAALSANVTALLGDRNATHRRDARRVTHGGQRRWRVASALAASVMAAVAIWSSQHLSPSHSTAMVASVQAPDHIFSALGDTSVASRGDEIFSSSQARPDIIFSAGHNDG
jgi:hypothetical protein